jgi:putative hydrolase of the HAD superfamily
MLRHEVSERAYWTERAELIGDALGKHSWVTTDLIRWLYHGPDDDWLNDEVIELMLDVKAAGLPLAALTNDLVDFHGQEWADRQAWLKHFDVIVDASVSGVLKPDPRAYAAAIELMGLPAGEIVYLDDMPWNVDGGAAAGLQAIEVRYDDRDHAVAEARTRLGLAVRPSDDVRGTAMPLVRIDLMEGRPPELIQELHERVAALVAEILDTPIERVRTYITQFPPQAWGIGGVPADVARADEVPGKSGAR